jgi:hypothetical protein
MNHNNTTTISRMHQGACWLIVAIFTSAIQLIAHGGFDHVIGTVVKVDNNVLTVKTSKGNVDVRLNEKTEITKGEQKAAVVDLEPGARVVVDIPKGRYDKIAHSVKVGVSKPTDADAHESHK